MINPCQEELFYSILGGDPFPGVYMKDMIVLLKNGYRMSRPKFISQTL